MLNSGALKEWAMQIGISATTRGQLVENPAVVAKYQAPHCQLEYLTDKTFKTE
jgi:hypothetical protein